MSDDTMTREAFANLDPSDIAREAQAGKFSEIRDNTGQTLLHWAAEDGAANKVAALVAAGVNPNARDQQGNSALHTAVKCGHITMVAALINKLPNANPQNEDGETPLHLAVAYKQPPGDEMVAYLVRTGAHPDARDRSGQTPWGLAQENADLKGTNAFWRLNDAHFE